jgi:hypothetical protein
MPCLPRRTRKAGSAAGVTRPSSASVALGFLILVLPLLGCDPGVAPPEVGGITIGQVEPWLMAGQTVQLVATVTSTTGSVIPGHPVTWTSSNEAVATVSEGGLVRGISGGSVTIQASSGGRSASRIFDVASAPCTGQTVGSIAVGENRSGTLARSDCTLFYGPAQGWSFDVSSRTGIQVIMRSSAFYPAPILTDRNLNPILYWDWHPEGSQLIGELPAGQYIIWASGGGDAAGGYQLSVREADFCKATSATQQVEIGGSISGTLGADGCMFVHGVRAVGYRLDVPATTGLQIGITTTAFDPILVVTDRDMEILWVGEGQGTRAEIQRRFAAGEYYVWVTGYRLDAAGPFSGSVTQVEIALCAIVGEIQPGQTVSGALSTTDCMMDNMWYVDPWRLVVGATTTLRIDLTSNHFDAFLILEDEHGGILAWDDDGGQGGNSRLTYTFQPGEYRIVATSYSTYVTGSYQISTLVVGAEPATMSVGVTGRPDWLKRRER